MISRIKKIPWLVLIAGSLTLGLAPFSPAPHLFEKLNMLVNGNLTSSVDIFDLCLHGVFPLLLIVKAGLSLKMPKE